MRLSTRENNAVTRCNKHKMYEAAAVETAYCFTANFFHK